MWRHYPVVTGPIRRYSSYNGQFPTRWLLLAAELLKLHQSKYKTSVCFLRSYRSTKFKATLRGHFSTIEQPILRYSFCKFQISVKRLPLAAKHFKFISNLSKKALVTSQGFSVGLSVKLILWRCFSVVSRPIRHSSFYNNLYLVR